MFTERSVPMIKNRIITFSFILFSCSAVYFVVNEIKHDLTVYRNCSRAGDEDKRVLLLGDLYVFIQKCRLHIAEDSNILLMTDNPGESLLLSYHLYPRKVYFYNHKPIRQYPVGIGDLDYEFLEKKKIKWVVSRFSKKHVENMLFQIENRETVKIIDAGVL